MNPAWMAPALGYLLGSIPFAYLIVRVSQARDIRAVGSGNVGAANVASAAGLGAGILALVFDVAKGYAAVWLAARLADDSIHWMTVAGLAAIVGHIFPIFLGFRGGRGVATGAGVFLHICWPAVAGACLVWLVVLSIWRYVSLGSICAAAALPLLTYALYTWPHARYAPPPVVSLGATLAAVLIILKHRPNLQRLAAGTEPRFRFRR